MTFRPRSFVGIAATSLASLLLAACGGGGGGSAPVTVAPTGEPRTPAPSAQSGVRLGGVVTFDWVPNTGGALDYQATVRKPVRGALVELLDEASRTLATTSTDDEGAYAFLAPPETPVSVRVRAQMSRGGPGPGWQVSVRDNTASDAVYAMETPILLSGTQALTRNIHAPSGWDGTGYAMRRVAAPFAVLDAVHESQAKVLTVESDAVFEPLRVFWSPDNLPAAGDRDLGQIGSTHFDAGSGTEGHAIYVLGKEDVDTDEYDGSVLVHEWGHYYQATFSRDDAPGGTHSLADSLDRRSAFSEGWANAWSGITLGRRTYMDSWGPGQGQSSTFDLEAGAGTHHGWHREPSIHAVFWTLHQKSGLGPIHDTFTGTFRHTLAPTSIHPFTAAFNQTAPDHAPVLAELLARHRISAASNDPFGLQEVNDGGLPGEIGALPLYRQATVGATRMACVTNSRGAGNKLGNHAYLRFTAASPRTYAITVSGPSTADPDFVVYNGGRLASSRGFGPSETLSLPLAAGEHVLVINDYNNSSASTCFAVSLS